MEQNPSRSRSRIRSSHDAAGTLRIYIDDILHLVFSTSRMAGLTSWKNGGRSPPLYVIEITPWKGEPILVEHDDRDLWCAILVEIDSALGKQLAS